MIIQRWMEFIKIPYGEFSIKDLCKVQQMKQERVIGEDFIAGRVFEG